ncbi:MAG: polysaccharide deacetylase family protein [bacterium]
MKQLLNYVDGKAPLPNRALLVTFDDGWRDNYTYAMPLLKSFGCPAVLFMVGDSIGRQAPFWQEQVFAAWKKGLLKDDSIDNWLESFKKVPDKRESSRERRLRNLIRCLSDFEPEYIIAQLERYANSFEWRDRAMLSKQELMELCRNRITIGAHGLYHRMLTKVNAKSIVNELKQLRNELDFVTGQQPDGINSLSFPHGSYSAQVVGHAREVGYNLLFSSDSVINVLKEKNRTKRIWGRIVIDSHNISKPNGKVCKVKLSRHVMFHSKDIISVDETLA